MPNMDDQLWKADSFSPKQGYRFSAPAPERHLLQTDKTLELLESEFVRSGVRSSPRDGLLLMHLRYPTDQTDAVLCGSDTTYRFVRELGALLDRRPHLNQPGDSSIVNVAECGAQLRRTVSDGLLAFFADVEPIAPDGAALNLRRLACDCE